MFLSDEDIEKLTRKKQHAAQARTLDALGIRYGMRADGSLVVMVAAVETLLNPTGRRKIADPEPNWDAVV